MKFEFEANTLQDTYKMIMLQRRKTYRDVAGEAGVHLSVAWRFSRRPSAMSFERAMKIITWMGIKPEVVFELWKHSEEE